jgi:hypothetical protein
MRPTAIILGSIAFTVSAIAADFTGTWKLSLPKSKLTSDLVSETMKIEQTGPNTYRTTVDTVRKSAKKEHQVINRICDGKEHPSTGVGFKQEGSSEICEQSPSTRKVTEKRDGKVEGEFTSTVSGDGKVLTNVWKGGETRVFERQ